MKVVIQRVKQARVSVEGKVISSIQHGFLLLVGIKAGDTQKEADALAEKVSKLRLMSDHEGKMNLSVPDVVGEMLIVSQFTLYADTKGGNRPSFITAARPDEAQPLYEHFLKQVTQKGVTVKSGQFGADMQIETVLDGPVTLVVSS